MVKLGLLFALAVAATTLAAPPAASNSLASSLNGRAAKTCTNPSNLLKNPSFESKTISPWIYHAYYPKQTTQKIVKGGYKSDHALQVTGMAKLQNDMGYSQMKQNFTTCKTGRYQLSWSMYLPKGAAQGIDYRAPQMVVWVTCPGGAAQVAYFTFRPNLFESNVSNPRKNSIQKVDQWVNTAVDLGTLQAGNCTLDVNWNVNGPAKGDPTSILTLKLDNFVIKALS
ncbi:hypothetical protein F53441_11227 [Fusarium austroafricanum]|uniref:Chitin-binding type-4 domain-containing protein n=1 Tax=Fusarium austroafricanum TaxID=2364996 RepID=A0A8H4K6G1_9HYPO|nr:hypothetical protein F53441_11227 [Fusarium austroafricanum]